MRRTPAPLQWLRLRVPATVMAVFALSLGVGLLLAYQLLVRAGGNDIDTLLTREHERFELAIGELLDEELAADPSGDPAAVLDRAVRRYLQLNPSSDSHWTIVTFEDGRRLAAANGPPVLEPLFADRTLPAGTLNVLETIETDVGPVRTVSVPVLLDGTQAATMQVAAPVGPLRRDALEATGLLAAATGATLLLGAIVLAASLWRSLTPLTDLARAARSTELRSLDTRVKAPPTDDEVGVLAHEFNRMLDRLDAATEAQQAFMASVGHELRTPITIARGHLELLRTADRSDPAALAEAVAILEDELARMGRLVDDLMAIARADMDDLVRPRPTELVRWFEELELRLAGLPGREQVRILPPPPVVIDADPDRLAQAVLNLITNAQLHTRPGTPIEVSAHAGAGSVTLVVADEGGGIPEPIRAEVLEPFVRGDAPGSTGLGLTVTAAITEAHGGYIDLATGEDGTRIGLCLPWDGQVEPTAEDHDRVPTERLAAPAGGHGPGD